MTNKLWIVVVFALLAVACGTETVEPLIIFDDGECSSSDPANWPSGPLDIAISNNTQNRTAVVVGTYRDGFGHADLLAYGSDISTRPGFIDDLEIYEVAPGSTGNLVFDHGAGTYFMVCLPDTNTMIVLDDVTIDS